MPILNYNEATANPGIHRINVNNLVGLRIIPSIGAEHDYILRARYQGRLVALKCITIEELSGCYGGKLKVEANVTHELQGSYGVIGLEGVIENMDVEIEGKKHPVEIGVVMRWAQGDSLLNNKTYWDKPLAKAFAEKEGVTIHSLVAKGLVEYIQGCMARGYIDMDLKERDIFIDGETFGITKIDYGWMQNAIDTNTDGFTQKIEIYEQKYAVVIRSLISLSLLSDSSSLQRIRLTRDMQITEEPKNILSKLGANKLLDLANKYGRDREYTSMASIWKGNPNPEQFFKFLEAWVPAMHELGERFIR